MSDQPKSFHISRAIHDYLLDHGGRPDAIGAALIEETHALGGVSIMQIAPEQGAFMALLARAIGAKRAIEVGTFTGFSALCLARAIARAIYLARPAPDDIVPCWSDLSREPAE